jgi:hypothetical protein
VLGDVANRRYAFVVSERLVNLLLKVLMKTSMGTRRTLFPLQTVKQRRSSHSARTVALDQAPKIEIGLVESSTIDQVLRV